MTSFPPAPPSAHSPDPDKPAGGFGHALSCLLAIQRAEDLIVTTEVTYAARRASGPNLRRLPDSAATDRPDDTPARLAGAWRFLDDTAGQQLPTPGPRIEVPDDRDRPLWVEWRHLSTGQTVNARALVIARMAAVQVEMQFLMATWATLQARESLFEPTERDAGQ